MSREAWQAGRAADNFPNGGEPFLPPLHLNDEAAWQLFNRSSERSLDAVVRQHALSVLALDRTLREVLPEARRVVEHGLRQAVDQGYAPPEALQRIDPAFTQTAMQAVDQYMLGSDLGAYNHRTDTVQLGAHLVDFFPLETVVHEVGGHKISGGTFVRQSDGTIIRTRHGFVTRNIGVPDPDTRHFGLDEAVQQHLTFAFLNGNFAVIDPLKRKDSNRSYFENRRLLDAFVARSGGTIDLRVITRASFEDTLEHTATTTDRVAMVRQAVEAYGPGAYRKFSLLCDAVESRDLRAEDVVERIQGPDRSAHRPGSIDIENLRPDFTDGIEPDFDGDPYLDPDY